MPCLSDSLLYWHDSLFQELFHIRSLAWASHCLCEREEVLYPNELGLCGLFWGYWCPSNSFHLGSSVAEKPFTWVPMATWCNGDSRKAWVWTQKEVGLESWSGHFLSWVTLGRSFDLSLLWSQNPSSEGCSHKMWEHIPSAVLAFLIPMVDLFKNHPIMLSY